MSTVNTKLVENLVKGLTKSINVGTNHEEKKAIMELLHKSIFSEGEMQQLPQIPNAYGIVLIAEARKKQFEAGYDLAHDVEHETPERFIEVMRCLMEDWDADTYPEAWQDDVAEKLANKTFEDKVATIGAMCAAWLDLTNELKRLTPEVSEPDADGNVIIKVNMRNKETAMRMVNESLKGMKVKKKTLDDVAAVRTFNTLMIFKSYEDMLQGKLDNEQETTERAQHSLEMDSKATDISNYVVYHVGTNKWCTAKSFMDNYPDSGRTDWQLRKVAVDMRPRYIVAINDNVLMRGNLQEVEQTFSGVPVNAIATLYDRKTTQSVLLSKFQAVRINNNLNTGSKSQQSVPWAKGKGTKEQIKRLDLKGA